MHHLRYIVLHQDGAWKIIQGGRRYADHYQDKTQALCAAIDFAEEDGHAGHQTEVLVRHEDGRYLTEWRFRSRSGS